MFCGLQKENDKYWMFVLCKDCMMNVHDTHKECHYYFDSESDFNQHLDRTGKDYDEVKYLKDNLSFVP